ncbi:MAG: SPFH domain-containing protein [Planctomycetota bacterium]|nr:SPFH domain-containing protein [Planctomycetota bacterium]
MRIDHLAYQRATNIAGFGFLLQLVAATVLLIFGYRGDEATARFASFYLYTGLIVWLGLIIVFNQHKLERLEALEEGELTATTSGESIFDRSGDEIRVAARRLRMMYKWVMPLASLLFVCVLFLLSWIMFDALAGMAGSDGWLQLLMTENKGWLIAVTLGFSVVCFIISRYLAGMAEQKVWQNLRAGAAVMVGNAVVLLAIAVGTIVRYFEIDDVMFFVAWAIPVFMVIVGVEVVLNLLLNLYRPRISGEFPRAAFDSRSLSLLATPDSLVRSLNDAVNYQFGFDITSSWGYQLVLRSSAWLCILGLLVLLALSTLSVVGGREQGLRLRSGALVGTEGNVVHDPGFFWKLPWPIEQTRVYDVSSLRSLPLTPMDKGRRDGFLWEDEVRLDPGEVIEPFIVGRSRLTVDSDARVTQDSESGEDAAGDFSGNYALVDMLVQLEYRIRPESGGEPGLLRYLHFGTESIQRRQEFTDRERALRDLALSVVTREMSTRSLDDVLSDDRADISGQMLVEVQRAFDKQQVGVEIVAINIPMIRPSGDAASRFQDLPLAMQQRDRSVANAERNRIALFTAIAGDPSVIDQIEESIDAVQDARARRDKLAEELGEDATQVRAASRELAQQVAATERLLEDSGGQAASIIASAERDRWIEIMEKRAQAGRVQSQVAAYRAAPELYRQRAIMQTYVRRLSGLRKYIVGIPPERMNVNVELRDLAAPNTVFEGVLEEDSTP